MLPKNLRLKKKDEIDMVWNKGQSFLTDFFICKYLPNSYLHNRPCFTFSKNIKLKIVERNRLKRQIAHAFKNADSEANEKHHDLILILKKIPSSKLFVSFYEDIKKIICKKNS